MQRHETILPNGRAMGWTEWGSTSGKPALFCPGAGCCGAVGFAVKQSIEVDLRMVSIDRAGLGRSEWHRGKSFETWSEDVGLLLQELGVQRPGVVAVSQGAPFAYALAANDIVSCVAIASGQDELAYPPVRSRLLEPVVELVRLACEDPASVESELASVATADWLWQMMDEMNNDVDRQFYNSPDFARTFREALAEGFIQGPDGYIRDTVLTMSAWPFRVESIICPVSLFYGMMDNSPVHSPDFGRTLSRRIPNSNLTQIPHAGGAVLWTHTEEILQSLL